jgi:hypothetical protein
MSLTADTAGLVIVGDGRAVFGADIAGSSPLRAVGGMARCRLSLAKVLSTIASVVLRFSTLN